MAKRALEASSESVVYRQPGYKMVVARQEMRHINGDLEITPRIFRRVGHTWVELEWSRLPKDSESVRRLLAILKIHRANAPPRFRVPIGALKIDATKDARLAG